MPSYLDKLSVVSSADVAIIQEKDKAYGGSWKKRGGVGAFMMLARKWDRLEKRVEEFKWNVFNAAEKDEREEGVIDDIRDLRRYLLLVEAEVLASGISPKARLLYDKATKPYDPDSTPPLPPGF